MDTLLPWQQKHVLIALLFEVVGTSFLVQRSIEATAICGMIVVMDTLLPWQQRHVLIALLFEAVGASFSEV